MLGDSEHCNGTDIFLLLEILNLLAFSSLSAPKSSNRRIERQNFVVKILFPRPSLRSLENLCS